MSGPYTKIAVNQLVHFVGFRGDEYLSAKKVWGTPDYFHFNWDKRAQRDIADEDTVIFARRAGTDPPTKFNGPDIFEEEP